MGKQIRREKGSGTLEWLPKTERWRIRITVDTPTGKKRKAFTAKTKRAVADKRDAYLQAESGAGFEAANLTVSEYLDRWLQDSVEQTRRPSTMVEYESVIRVHLKPAIGRVKLADLKAGHIQAMLSEMRRGGYAPGTARRVYAILGAALNQAVKWQLLSVSPMAGVEAPRAQQGSQQHGGRGSLTLEETRRLFDAAKAWRGGRLHVPLVLAVSTGMRQGEMLGLLWDDFDAERGTLTVQRTIHRHKDSWTYGPTKGGKSRVLEVDERLVSLLKDHRRSQLEERMKAPEWTETGHVFTTLEGKPIHRAVLYQSFKRLLRREGLPDITFHELRHTAATILAERGAHPDTVRQILGHADISTTLRVYTHAWPGQTRSAATALADVIL